MTRRFKLLVLAAGLVVLGFVARSDLGHFVLREIRPRGPLPPSSLPEQSPIKEPRVVVIHKSERVLGLYIDEELAAVFPIGLGRHPEGPKTKQGDGRTPEGRYYICTRNDRSRFHLFLGLSYPSIQDAERGVLEHRISKHEYDGIATAIRAKRQPPWDTALGGEVGIHGYGAGSDWTLGCIALDNRAIEHLWSNLEKGDLVLIEP